LRRPLCLFTVLFAAAIWAAVLICPPQDEINEKADGKYVIVTGTVEYKDYALKSGTSEPYCKLTLQNARIEDGLRPPFTFEIQKDDLVLCLLSDDMQMQQTWAREGARVRVRGKLRLFTHPSNDGQFDAYRYYREIGGYLFSINDAHILGYTKESNPLRVGLYRVRSHLSDAIDRMFDKDAGVFEARCASIMKAMLLGQSGLVEPALKERYQAAGIIHVICISGLHISLLGMAVFRFLLRIPIGSVRMPAAPAALFTVFLLYLYGEMTGMHTSCLRAIVMFGFQAAAKVIGRTYDLLTALAVAAILLLAGQPSLVLHSGFLFSFAAVLAIGTVHRYFPVFLQPFSVMICTIPVQLLYYYTFPLYSIVLNVIVIALAPFLMAGGLVSLCVSVMAGACLQTFPLAGQFLTASAHLSARFPAFILWLYEQLCIMTERLPFYRLTPGRPHNWEIPVYYLLIAAAAWLGTLCKERNLRAVLGQAGCIVAALSIVFLVRIRPPFALSMLDVGQGDGLCLQVEDEDGRQTLMVDGGSTSRQKIGEYILTPFLRYHGVDTVDHWILTHEDLDHCSGLLEVLRESDQPGSIRIRDICLPYVDEKERGQNYAMILQLAKSHGITITYLHRGMALHKGLLHIQCLHPEKGASYEDANSYSAVLLVQYGSFSALMTGDLEGDGERDLLTNTGEHVFQTDVFKVAHHGSAKANSGQLLSHFPARAALISCGKDNPYGHPAPEALARLRKAGMQIWDTRSDGQIRVVTDGRGAYRVHTFY
jgi:competence protein ComEC